MVEELKLAIKIDDATIEQSLLKQFANAQKMADKVVLDFKNVNFDDKQIEAKFKEMQKKAGQNPIDLTIGGNTLDMLGQIDKRLTEIFSIGKGKSFIDSSSIATDIGKIENKINELNKKYEESQKKLSSIGSGGISGKDVNLVDNEEFKKLSQEVSELKNQFDDLKTHMQLLDDYTVPTDRFFELQSQVETTTVKVSDLVEEFAKLSNAQKALSSTPQESNISLDDSSATSVIDKQLSSTKKLIGEEEKLSNIQNKIISFKPKNKDTVINEKTEETLQKSSEYASKLLETAQQIVRLANNNVGFISAEDLAEIEKLYQLFPELRDFRYNDMSLDFMSKSDLDDGWMDAFMDFSATLPKAAEYFEMIDEFSSHLSDDGRFWGNEQDFAKDFLHVDPDALDRIAEVNNVLNEALGTEENYTSKYKEVGQQLKDGSIDIQDAIRDILQLEFPNNKIMEIPDGFWVAPEKLNKTTKSIEDVSSAISDVSNKVLQFPDKNIVLEQDKIQDELQQTQNEIDSTQSKYQSLLDVAKKQLDDDSKRTNYYSGRTTETQAFANFKFSEQAKRSNYFDVLSKDYDELCDLIDKTEEELKSGSIGFDDAIDRMVAAYQKYDATTKIDVGGFDFLNKMEIAPSVLSDAEKAILSENEAIKESEYTLQDYINAYIELKKVKESSLSVDPKIKDVTPNGRPIIAEGSDESFKAELMMKDMESEVLQIYGKDLSVLANEHIKASASAKEHAKAENQVTQAIKDASSTSSQHQTKDAFPDKDVSASVESATNSIKEENNVLEQNTQKVKENTQAKEQNANANLNKYDKRLDSYNGKVDKYQATIDRFNDGGWTSDAYLKNVQAVHDAVKQYATLLDNIKTNQNGIATDEDIQNLDKYEKKIKDTIATVTNMSASEKGYNFVSGQKELDKIHKLLNENSKMSSEAKAKIKAYYREIESGNPTMSLDKIHGRIMKIYNAEIEAGRAGRSLKDIFQTSRLHQMVAQVAGMFSFYDLINLGRQFASTVTDINTQITGLAKVSEQSSKQIYADFDSYADIAKEVRGTISDTIAATADWSKNGYSIPDAKQLAEVSQLYKNVGDGIDIDAANESLISTLKGFQLEADQAEHIVDVFNEVSNNEAISSGGIGEALQRSAASFNAASTSLEKSVSLVTATNSVLQDPEKVGNMWRTVSARLRGSETELKEMGEDTDGLVTSTSKLQALVKGITGFDIMKDKDTYKDIYDIVLGIGEKWQDLSDIDRASLLEALAGKQQSNALAAALSNIDILKKSYEEATNAEGSARKENEEYSKSIQASIDLTKAKLEELSNDLLSSNFLKGAIDAGGKLLELLDFIISDGREIPAIFTTIGAVIGAKKLSYASI